MPRMHAVDRLSIAQAFQRRDLTKLVGEVELEHRGFDVFDVIGLLENLKVSPKRLLELIDRHDAHDGVIHR